LKDDQGTIWLQSIYGLIWNKKATDQNFALYKSGNTTETMSTIVLADGKVEVISAETTKPFPYPLYSTVDSKGITWLTNSEGKAVYRWKNGKRLNDLDKLLFPIHDMAVRAIYTQQDEIWIGNENGLVIIDTKVNDVATKTKPRLLIHSVTLGSDSILWGGFGEMPEMLAELNHNENELHFTFSLDQTPIEGNTFYRYRLNNGNWSAWSTNTSANFTNLAHGIYTFSVQARDVTNRLTDITSIQFIIKTPFYLRWYMNLVYVLLLLALFYLLFRLRLRKLGKDKERLERLVQERTAEVVRLEKMATVGKLTQGLIDRILNPLNYINNFAKLSEGLVKDVKANVEDEKDNMSEDNYEDTLDVLDMLSGNLQKVGEHGQSTTRTLKAMEEMLKDRSGGIVPMNLATVIHQNEQMVLEYFKNEIDQHHIKTVFDYPETIQINGNAEQLSKTIMCMLGNSVYAIVKKAQKTSFSPELSLHATLSGNSAKVVIHDNGIGIEETIINKIFDPFFTTKTTGEASGVGLYLSREIIQNHGGDISVKSVKDEYTEFTIIIPLKKA
jgi:signal transduction histidine kinase